MIVVVILKSADCLDQFNGAHWISFKLRHVTVYGNTDASLHHWFLTATVTYIFIKYLFVYHLLLTAVFVH